MEQKDLSELTSKEIITLGCSNSEITLQNVEAFVKRYNEQSVDYQLKIVPYGQPNEWGGVTGAEDELIRDLLQGEGPDLFDLGFSTSFLNTCVEKGVLESLNPYLDAAGIELVEGLERALSIDGKVYALNNRFSINPLIVQKGYSADGGLSIEQCVRLAADHPGVPMQEYSSRPILLSLLMNADMERYLDPVNGTCHFDSEEFVSLLDTVSIWTEDIAPAGGGLSQAEKLYQKQYLLANATITSMVSYLELKEIFSGFCDITGYPNTEGSPKYPVTLTNMYGIGSASSNKEGAFDALLYLLQTDTGTGRSLPVVKEAFEEALHQGQQENETLLSYYSNEELSGLTPTEKDCQALRQMVDHCYLYSGQQQSIQAVINEEAQFMFAGEKTADEAARIIQNRVSLILEENK